MQVTFNFDNVSRSFTMSATDELEKIVLKEIHDRVAKGQTVQIAKIETPEGPTEFRFEVKVNGHKGKVIRDLNPELGISLEKRAGYTRYDGVFVEETEIEEYKGDFPFKNKGQINP